MSCVREVGYTLEQAKESVGKGWHLFLDAIFKALPEGCVIVQVKEKFGGLRVYWEKRGESSTPESAEFNDLIRLSEDQSHRTCEECGAEGKTSSWGGYWIKTLCPLHVEIHSMKIKVRKLGSPPAKSGGSGDPLPSDP